MLKIKKWERTAISPEPPLSFRPIYFKILDPPLHLHAGCPPMHVREEVYLSPTVARGRWNREPDNATPDMYIKVFQKN